MIKRERRGSGMRIYDIIAKKRDGEALTEDEIAFFIKGYVEGEIPDYQASALLMAIYLRGMTPCETAALTMAMARSGGQVDLSGIDGPKVDKHSTGGVGDKTTLIAAPLAASLGVRVAKMSGRGLGFTGGTIDKLESIPGFRTSLTQEEFFSVVRRVGVSVIGQTANLVPADKKLYALRDVTATVSSLPLIASSIMSKKIAAGADHILLDVKTGSGAFMKSLEDSVALAKAMVSIGAQVGRDTIALITDMDRPLGLAVGNALEIQEVCATLQGRGPADLTALGVELAANMLALAGKGSLETCREQVRAQVHNGVGFATFCRMVEAQGGDVRVLRDASRFQQPKASAVLEADRDGYLFQINTEQCGVAAVALGAGREKLGDSIDFSAGIVLDKTVGDAVRRGEPIAHLYAADSTHCARGLERLQQAVQVRAQAPKPVQLIQARVTAEGVKYF